MSSSSSVPRIQVFRPTMEEFKNFSKYIEKMESMGAHKAGLAKIIPPEGWCPRKRGYDDIDLMIPAPISQIVTGRQGLYQQINVQQKAMNVKEFRKLAESPKYRTPPHFDYEDLERKYWKNITFNSPIYGADVSGSIYDDGVEEFNIRNLNTILDLVKEDYEIQIEGVNTAYLYFGMWKTTFAWHTEDMDLYSINYLHFGAPKSWYVVPPEHGRRLERLAAGFFHGSHQLCNAFLRHKMTIIAPHILKKYSIPCSKITQEPGEFMITFPFGYHSGFNHGFNCAESTNFALPRWIEYGKRSLQCTCRNDCVKICMDVFVRKFQPERYELWKAGKDFGAHPEDPSRHYAAPPPNKMELSVATNAKKEKKTPKLMQKIKRHPVSKLDKLQNKKRKESTDEMITDEEEPDENLKEKAKKVPKKKSIKKATETKVSKCDEDSMTSVCTEDNLSSQSNGDALMEVKGGESPPPELKPFWDPEEKAKLENDDDDSQADTIIDEEIVEDITSQIYTREAEIIDKFPLLKNAVDFGSLSVKFLDENEEEEEEIHPQSSPQQTITAKYADGSASFYNFELSKSIFDQNWRCEQVNNGLKIKLVSPKSNQFSLLHSPSEFPKIATVGECSVSYATEDVAVDTKASDTSRISDETVSIKPGSKNHSHLTAENIKVKRATHLVDSWAHPLSGLWQHEKYNFEAECKFNQRLSGIPPYCAVCVLFTPMFEPSSFPETPTTIPSCSQIKMPAFCYGDSLNSECIFDTNSLVLSDGSAPLLTCCICKVCVHAPCYGVSAMPSDSWICNRCSVQVVDVQCCLCVLRGGALKATTDGRWAHIVCTILISETFFEDAIRKEPVNVSKISVNRQKLKCKYCFKAHAQKDQRGCCVQCQCGKCYLPFHVTCGYMAGVIFEPSDWPDPISIICTKHSSARRKPLVRNLTSVSVGESVIAKHKNKRYYWASVKEKYVQDYYSILFEDNSHSTNTLPEDIVSKNVSLYGPPEMNEKVKVKWTDGKVYNGIFKGSQTVEMFLVEFDDGTVLQQERKEIFAANEELPKEVQSKMSHSSERRGLNIAVPDLNGKRFRPNSQKYYAI